MMEPPNYLSVMENDGHCLVGVEGDGMSRALRDD